MDCSLGNHWLAHPTKHDNHWLAHSTKHDNHWLAHSTKPHLKIKYLVYLFIDSNQEYINWLWTTTDSVKHTS